MVVADPYAPAREANPASWCVLGVVAAIALLTIQVVVLVTLLDTRSDLSELRDEIAAAEPGAPTDLGAGQFSPRPALPAATGNLQSCVGIDAAVGRNIGDVTNLG